MILTQKREWEYNNTLLTSQAMCVVDNNRSCKALFLFVCLKRSDISVVTGHICNWHQKKKMTGWQLIEYVEYSKVFLKGQRHF